ncbi:MAG: AmmeMemoRadiSam system protein B [Deltaproteobacteria bacterium]|nr:AmmeMemoRadiSam system protein B [Deltaproteobacteria bacterium]
MERVLRFRPYLNFNWIIHEGQKYFIIDCQLKTLKNPILIHSSLVDVLLGLLHGVSELDFKAQLATKFSLDEINDFVRMLEDQCLLQNDQWEDALQKLKNDFKKSPVREPFLEGKSFPQDPESRRNLVKTWLNQIDEHSQIQPDVIILPHIDYQRGWQVYAETLKNMRVLDKKRFAVFIGTDHKAGSRLLSICNKPYHIAGFSMALDTEGIKYLEKTVGDWIFDDMINHISEHSLEITMPFLEPVWHNDIKTIPIIVGPVEQMRDYDELKVNSEFLLFTRALSEYLSDKLRQTVFVLGIDFSHLGKAFGDPFELDDSELEKTGDYDSRLKNTFEIKNSEQLFNAFATENLRQKVCGFSTMTLLRQVFDNLKIQLEAVFGRYRQSLTQNNECLVSFWGSIGKILL